MSKNKSNKLTTFQVWEGKNKTFFAKIPNTNAFFLIEGDDGFPSEEITIGFDIEKQSWSKKKSIKVSIELPINIFNLLKIGKMIQKNITEKIFDCPLSGQKTLPESEEFEILEEEFEILEEDF